MKICIRGNFRKGLYPNFGGKLWKFCRYAGTLGNRILKKVPEYIIKFFEYVKQNLLHNLYTQNNFVRDAVSICDLTAMVGKC